MSFPPRPNRTQGSFLFPFDSLPVMFREIVPPIVVYERIPFSLFFRHVSLPRRSLGSRSARFDSVSASVCIIQGGGRAGVD